MYVLREICSLEIHTSDDLNAGGKVTLGGFQKRLMSCSPSLLN